MPTNEQRPNPDRFLDARNSEHKPSGRGFAKAVRSAVTHSGKFRAYRFPLLPELRCPHRNDH